MWQPGSEELGLETGPDCEGLGLETGPNDDAQKKKGRRGAGRRVGPQAGRITGRLPASPTK